MPTIVGPRGAIEFERDRWGYPRIRARDLLDGTYARGYLHGLDRQVQLHLSLMAARGRLMELLGDVELARLMDYATRALHFAGAPDAQLGQVPERLMPLLHAYCEGLNAGIAARGRPTLLRLAKIPTEHFEPTTLVVLYRLLIYFGLASLEHAKTVVATELVVDGVDARGLELLFGDVAHCASGEDLGATQLPPVGFLPAAFAAGSNAFAVAKPRSASGGALLMGEFHMEIARFPPVIYISHEEYSDGTYLQGASVPGVPYLSAGRTRDVSWSLTYAHGDAIDCLIERCEGESYVAADGLRPMHRRVERVKQRGRKALEEWVFYDHDGGTVLGDARVPGMYPSLRWNGRDHVGHDLAMGLGLAAQTSAASMAEHIRNGLAFSGHWVFADRQGHIASAQSGQVADRPAGWRGVVPRAGWDLADRDFPRAAEACRSVVIDPDAGYVVSANATIEPPQGPIWCSGPEPDARFRRLSELLSANDRVSLDDMVSCSYDRVDLAAKRLLAVWEPLLPEEPEARALCAWARAGADGSSEGAARWLHLFYALHEHVMEDVVAQLIGADRARRLFVDLHLGLLFQAHVDEALCLNRLHLVDRETLRASLGRAWAQAKAKTSDVGDAFAIVPFENLVFRGRLARMLGFGQSAVRLPGSPCSPFQVRVMDVGGAPLVAGPAFHLLFDMSDDGGWYNVPGGASERRFGPGYGKGVEAWRTAELAPLGNPSPSRAPSPR